MYKYEQAPRPEQPKKRMGCFSIFGIAIAILWVIGSILPDDNSSPAALPSSKASVTSTPTQTTSPTPISTTPSATVSELNAIRTAIAYLDSQGFSRSRLIEQLVYEGYSEADATYAVENITVNWNEQAARTAKAYLDSQGFSRSRLIEQLMYEGFSRSQAKYGADSVGLN